MRIAINITREYMGGITSTNRDLLDCLHGTDVTFVGIELNPNRTFISPIVYRHLSPAWFKHRIISICDYRFGRMMKRAKSLGEVEKKFRPIINEVRKILREEKPDAILINGTYYIPWIISIAAKLEKIPIILWYAGVLTYETEQYKPRPRKIFRSMEKSIVNRAEKIIFPSMICQKAVYEKVAKINKVKRGLIVPNPIPATFTQAKQIERPVENQLAFIGRDTPVKNLKAFCQLHLALKKIGWQHEATIVTDSRKKNRIIPKSINVLPAMSAADLKTFYATQGLIVSPSTFETFGNVPIEAACLGIPVLVSDTMGCSEVLSRAKLENMIIDFSDMGAVTHRVMELCGQYILPRQINNLRKQVDAKYVAQKIMGVVQQVV